MPLPARPRYLLLNDTNSPVQNTNSPLPLLIPIADARSPPQYDFRLSNSWHIQFRRLIALSKRKFIRLSPDSVGQRIYSSVPLSKKPSPTVSQFRVSTFSLNCVLTLAPSPSIFHISQNACPNCQVPYSRHHHSHLFGLQFQWTSSACHSTMPGPSTKQASSSYSC